MNNRLNSTGNDGEPTRADLLKMVHDRFLDAMRAKEDLLAPQIEAYAHQLQQDGSTTRMKALEVATEAYIGPYEIILQDRAALTVRRLLALTLTPLIEPEQEATHSPPPGQQQALVSKPSQTQGPRNQGQPQQPSSNVVSKAEVATIAQQFARSQQPE